jgi:acyl carrier protein
VTPAAAAETIVAGGETGPEKGRAILETSRIMEGTLPRVTEVFRDVFNDDELVISRSTTAEDIVDWDSFMHVSLIIRIEKSFGIRFSSTEVANLRNVGELVDLVEAKSPR